VLKAFDQLASHVYAAISHVSTASGLSLFVKSGSWNHKQLQKSEPMEVNYKALEVDR